MSVSIKANFRTIAARFGGDVQVIATAINGSDHAALVATLRAQATTEISYSLEGAKKSASISIEDLVVTETPRSGWSVSSHAGESVALDLELTPALIEAGLVREIIRAIQEERKQSGFDISDRIHVKWNGAPDVVSAIASGSQLISDEVLALSITQDSSLAASDSEIGLALSLTKN